MPRYFFNFDNGESGVTDLVGHDLPDDESAKSQAMKLAADLSTDKTIEGELPTFQWIEVVDEAQRAVARLPVNDIFKEPNRSS